MTETPGRPERAPTDHDDKLDDDHDDHHDDDREDTGHEDRDERGTAGHDADSPGRSLIDDDAEIVEPNEPG